MVEFIQPIQIYSFSVPTTISNVTHVLLRAPHSPTSWCFLTHQGPHSPSLPFSQHQDIQHTINPQDVPPPPEMTTFSTETAFFTCVYTPPGVPQLLFKRAKWSYREMHAQKTYGKATLSDNAQKNEAINTAERQVKRKKKICTHPSFGFGY